LILDNPPRNSETRSERTAKTYAICENVSVVKSIVCQLAVLSCQYPYASRQLPVAADAPAVGDRAPEFALADTTGRMVALSMLLSEPMPGIQGEKPRGVLLVFYRGYW